MYQLIVEEELVEDHLEDQMLKFHEELKESARPEQKQSSDQDESESEGDKEEL